MTMVSCWLLPWEGNLAYERKLKERVRRELKRPDDVIHRFKQRSFEKMQTSTTACLEVYNYSSCVL